VILGSILVEGDIARLIMTSGTAHSLSISPITFARWQHASRSWSCSVNFWITFRGKRS